MTTFSEDHGKNFILNPLVILADEVTFKLQPC